MNFGEQKQLSLGYVIRKFSKNLKCCNFILQEMEYTFLFSYITSLISTIDQTNYPCILDIFRRLLLYSFY